jgi:hypothetical protein
VIDVENAAIGAFDEEFGENLFFCSEDDSILALDPHDGSE